MTCLLAVFTDLFSALDRAFTPVKAVMAPRLIVQSRYYSGPAMPPKVR